MARNVRSCKERMTKQWRENGKLCRHERTFVYGGDRSWDEYDDRRPYYADRRHPAERPIVIAHEGYARRVESGYAVAQPGNQVTVTVGPQKMNPWKAAQCVFAG